MAHFLTADSCRIYYESHGTDSDPAIVLLNGLTQTTVNWAPHVQRLKGRYRVVLYDARGQGRSGLGRVGLPLRIHIEDFSALMDHLNLKRAHLVGMSLGGRLALAAAGSRPERVDRLVLCSCAGGPSEPGTAMVKSWLEILRIGGLDAMAWAMLPAIFGQSFLKNHGQILDKIVKALSWRNRAEAIETQLTALAGYPPNTVLAEGISASTLVVSGAEDLLVPFHAARALADGCRGELRILEATGHSVPAEAPELFSRVVLDFLSSEV